MRLLIDQNLSRRLASLLQVDGHDVVHAEDVGLATTADPLILSWCCTEARLLVTADKKLTKFLASSNADCPSVLITRDLRTLALTPAKPIRAEFLPLGPTT